MNSGSLNLLEASGSVPACTVIALPLHLLYISRVLFNLLNADLNPFCHLLALFGTHHILHVSRIRVK